MSFTPEFSQLEQLLATRVEARVLPGLARIRDALASLGNPQQYFPSVLVLGTNGKGSTCAFLESLLRASGLRVGLYTSPHLVRVEERIRIAGSPVATDKLLAWVRHLSHFAPLSYFETLTAAAFALFAENRVDFAVIEAGLGGRWDATNVKDHEVVLLTNVGTDHQAWLGPTREHIAAEKAAAIRGKAGILGDWDPELLPVIRAHAQPGIPLFPADRWARLRRLPSNDPWYPRVQAEAFGEQWELTLPLAGQFQVRNYHLALAALSCLNQLGLAPRPSAEALVNATRAVSWPGRCEFVNWRGRRLLLDGAHNREAIEALVTTLKRAGVSGEVDLIFACLDDKPLEAMADLLLPVVRKVTVVPLASPRARSVHDLAQAFPSCARASSLVEALAATAVDRITLVTGSLRLVGEVQVILEYQG